MKADADFGVKEGHRTDTWCRGCSAAWDAFSALIVLFINKVFSASTDRNKKCYFKRIIYLWLVGSRGTEVVRDQEVNKHILQRLYR